MHGMVILQMLTLLSNARENDPRGIGRCFSSPALLTLLLLSDGVGELQERLVQHKLRRLGGVVEQDPHVQHSTNIVVVVVQWLIHVGLC